ncbi:MAG: hypothetical protein JXA54_06540 [Candidatus Heimdallarchaeota archaeon]|nr:hypothetical protein [Candidatus Heimdallarchaeota archaeon]
MVSLSKKECSCESFIHNRSVSNSISSFESKNTRQTFPGSDSNPSQSSAKSGMVWSLVVPQNSCSPLTGGQVLIAASGKKSSLKPVTLSMVADERTT